MNVLPKRLERVILPPLAVAVGALGMAGCGGQSPRVQTAVKRAIQPVMKDVARDDIELANRKPSDCTSSIRKAIAEMTCQNTGFGANSDSIEVTMRSRNGVADPSLPLYEEISTFSISGENDSVANGSVDELVAPGGGRYAQNPSNPNAGWVAYSRGGVTIAGASEADAGGVFDTTNSSLYVENWQGDISNPEDTASYIASNIIGLDGQSGDLQKAMNAIQGTN